MHAKVIQFAERPFIRNVMMLGSGSAAAQLITLLLSPFITRLYGPEAYGMMGVFISFTFIIIPVAAMTYPEAMILANNSNEASGLARISMICSLAVASGIGLLLFLFNKEVISLFNLQGIGNLLYLIPVIVIFSAYLEIIESWLVRTKQFGVKAKVEVVQASLLQGSRLGIGSFYPLSLILIISWSLGIAGKAFLLSSFSSNEKKLKFSWNLNQGTSLKKIAISYKDFPLLRAPQTILYGISEGLPVLLLAGLFGPASAGFYSIGRTVLSMPTNLITRSVGSVLYSKFVETATNHGDLKKILLKSTLALAAIGAFPFGIICLFGPEIFVLVFGPEWLMAGEYSRWIAIWVFFLLISNPSRELMPVLSYQGFHLKFTILSLITGICSLGLGAYIFASEIAALAIFGISAGILNLMFIIITVFLCKNFKFQERV
ncbi:lipopolysaccharide biosynthesis protein [Planococcus beigongshangi]|uniref:lipopolysaccharide biosynthesis protein n=1 Tax=Planococcus beigongshangi TaxID=2782536 RepID=UPI00193C2F75|nr:oligosaccharide flippase family protein [Planococcus beigongshangi]